MRELGLAIVALAIGSTATVAADMPVKAVPMAPVATVHPGFFGYVSGAWARNSSEDTFIASFIVPGNSANGYSGKVFVGYLFANSFDLALGIGGTKLRDALRTTGTFGHSQSSRLWTFDAEVGYRWAFAGGSWLRPFAGVRYASWRVEEGFPFLGGGSPGAATIETKGWGPRVGFDGKLRVAAWPISLIGGLSASWISGTLNETGAFSGGFPPPVTSISRRMTNYEANIGLAFEPTKNLAIAVGYQWDYWKDVTLLNFAGPAGGPGSGTANRRTGGPFARLSYNY